MYIPTRNILSSISLSVIVMLILQLPCRHAEAGVGESAVITLAFPPGARATGTGEAFTGLSDDPSATYYNPAGLGLSPLANSWKVFLVDQKYVFTALASKKKRDFGAKSLIWAGTNKGLLRYNGKLWERFDYYLIEQDDDLEKIVRKYIDGEDKELLKQALWKVRLENGIGMKRYAAIKTKLSQRLTTADSLSHDSLAAALARQIVEIPSVERSTAKIYGIIASAIDSSHAGKTADEITAAFKENDKDFEDFTELKIPFSVAVTDSVAALVIDASDKLWVATAHGLWRYYENRWTRFTMLEGLPSNVITALASGPYGSLAVGTDKGVVHYINGEWEIKTDSTSQLPSQEITALTFGEHQYLIYAGTKAGLVKIDEKKILVFDTADGLLSNDIRALFMDSRNRLWIGGPNGVTIFNNATWKRYQFPNSMVSSFAEQNEKTVWIGTDKGAISHTTRKSVTDEQGNVTEPQPEWKAFHSKNALVGERVLAVIGYDKDVWLATERAINQYDNADRQTSIAFEMLLPAFKLTELWHLYWALTWPTQEWGTIGGSINYINMGQNPITDELGREKKVVRSWEGVFGLSYGLTVREDFALGISAKYVVSALAPGLGENGEGVGQTFAIDASLLKRKLLIDKFDVGFMVQNMGPHIFYIDRNSRDPIPFTLRLGLVYHAVETPVYDLKFLFDMHKEIVKNYYDGEPDPFYKALWTDLINDPDDDLAYELQEINYNLGMEFWYTNFLALRTGFLFDYLGERYEWTVGGGIRYGTLNFDGSWIIAPEGFLKPLFHRLAKVWPSMKGKDGATGARQGQWRLSFIFMF
ncbi:MAG: PorV/PorQ family protein [Chitinispirillaceae bacterium]|nr:PorV/PorQ family protein [Chitinispirillaceae bacterium]